MKLNYKRTLLVGMAFFLISAFWQAYDHPLDPHQPFRSSPNRIRRGHVP